MIESHLRDLARQIRTLCMSHTGYSQVVEIVRVACDNINAIAYIEEIHRMTDKELPEYNEDITCENPECKFAEAEVLTGLYGIFGGGGPGPYTMCGYCGAVLSKSPDQELCETHNEPTEIKTADVQGSDTDEPRGS